MQLEWIRRATAVTAAAAFVGVFAVSGLTAKDPLPTGAAAKQLDADLAYLEAGLEAKKGNSKIPLKSVAMLVALNAQNQMGGTDGEKMAGVRDQALKVAGALSQKEVDWAAAAKEVAAAKDAKGDAKKEVKLAEQHEFDIHDLMTVFKPKARGGRGLEDDIRKFAKTAGTPEQVAEIGNLTALIGQYTEAMAPTDEGADKKKKWTDWSKEMQKLGKEAAEEGLKGGSADKAGLLKKVQAIDANCTACHNVFKH